MSNFNVHHSRAWFTADTHFFHRKCAELRKFDGDVERMNEVLIYRWNLRVKQGDTVFMLGDISFAGAAKTDSVLKRLNGNLVLVTGNHDKAMNAGTRKLFLERHDLLTIKVQLPEQDKVQRIVACHFPLLVWDMAHHGAWHIHGHSHGNARYPQPRGRIVDVGVDAQENFPISFGELQAQMNALPIAVHDHHVVRSNDEEGDNANEE